MRVHKDYKSVNIYQYYDLNVLKLHVKKGLQFFTKGR